MPIHCIIDDIYEATAADLSRWFFIQQDERFELEHNLIRWCRDQMSKLEKLDGDKRIVVHNPELKEGVIYVGMSYGDCRENCEYDSDWSINIIASLDLKKVQDFIRARRTKDVQYNHDLGVLQRALSRWREENPRPERPDIEPIPKWKTGIKMNEITPEMRAERDGIKARNTLIVEQGRAMDAEYQGREDAEAHRVLNKLNIPEANHECYMGYCSERECRYRIETIPYV
jgi:hypothetical protein